MSEAGPATAGGGWLILRYGVIGIVNSGVHVALFALLSLVPGLDHGPMIVLGAWIGSIPIGYVLQSRLVWHKPLSWTGLTKLASSYIPSVLISTAAAAALDAGGIGYVIQEATAVVVAAVVGFFLQKYWVYR